MKKVNFNALKNIPVTDDLLQKALDIPNTARPKPYAAWLRHTRTLAWAACLVLVGVLGAAMYLLMGQGQVLQPTPPSAGITGHLPTEPVATEPTKAVNGTSTIPTETAEDAVSPTAPTQKTGATEQNNTRPPAATNNPTEATAARRPTAAGQEPTTAPPAAETDAPTKPRPTRPPTQPAPTAAPTAPPAQPLCTAQFPARLLYGDLFCCIYDGSHHIVGSADPFHAQHKVQQISVVGDEVIAVYDPEAAGLNLTAGTYTYTFYCEPPPGYNVVTDISVYEGALVIL